MVSIKMRSVISHKIQSGFIFFLAQNHLYALGKFRDSKSKVGVFTDENGVQHTASCWVELNDAHINKLFFNFKIFILDSLHD